MQQVLLVGEGDEGSEANHTVGVSFQPLLTSIPGIIPTMPAIYLLRRMSIKLVQTCELANQWEDPLLPKLSELLSRHLLYEERGASLILKLTSLAS